MIQIKVTHDSEEHIVALELEGHSFLTAEGTDILCAAVSVLSENLGNSLRAILNLPVTIEEAKGLYSICMDLDSACYESDLLFASAILGYRVLAKQYPDRIEIKEIIKTKENNIDGS